MSQQSEKILEIQQKDNYQFGVQFSGRKKTVKNPKGQTVVGTALGRRIHNDVSASRAVRDAFLGNMSCFLIAW